MEHDNETGFIFCNHQGLLFVPDMPAQNLHVEIELCKQSLCWYLRYNDTNLN